MNNQSKKEKGKKSKFLYIVIFAFLIYMIAQFISIQLQIRDNREAIRNLDLNIEQQTLRIEELNYQLDMEDDYEYIEHVAREERDYVYPGEIMFYDMDGK